MTVDLFGAEQATRAAMGSHQRAVGGSDEWLTPPELIRALGQFDLDPCSPITRPWPTASRHYTIEDDGLRQSWDGRVWLNPPYAQIPKWLARLVAHGNGTALIFARTETQTWHQHVWPHASAVLFLKGRLNFHAISGARASANAGAPSALIAYGDRDAEALATSGLPGALVRRNGISLNSEVAS